jgi:hydroxymethylbilane synthase
MAGPLLRIGSRGSPLALAQTHQVRDLLRRAHPDLAADGAIEVVVIKTSGDLVLDRTLADVGGKGLFTKELDEALLDGRIDVAVHSMKDVPTWLPAGLEVACVLEREDPRDAFVSFKAPDLAALPAGAVVGTASLRRQAQVLNRRPDLKVAVFRGNVQTRLRKLEEGQADATLLALAGLRRLGLADVATAVVPTGEMLPAVAQGAVGVAGRSGDARARHWLAPLHHAPSAARVAAERALLEVLDGSCRTPIAALAEIAGDVLSLRGLVARPDGSRLIETARRGPVAEAVALGRDAGEELKGRAGPGFFTAG